MFNKQRIFFFYVITVLFRGNGWEKHYKEEHNVYSYLNYIILVENMNSKDYDEVERYIK